MLFSLFVTCPLAHVPCYSPTQVHAGLERQHAAFIGASVVAKLPLFEELCVFKEDWDENGPEALEKWLTLWRNSLLWSTNFELKNKAEELVNSHTRVNTSTQAIK